MSLSVNVGDHVSVTRIFDQATIADFANLVGVPATEIAHVPDPLIAGLFSFLIGVKVPGPGTNYLKQNLAFSAPAPIGVPLTATVEITRLRPEKHLCDLATTCVDAQGQTICTGRALVLVKDVGSQARFDRCAPHRRSPCTQPRGCLPRLANLRERRGLGSGS